MKSVKKQGGFTLLELLVVVGLMAAVAVVAVSTYDDADKGAAVATDLSNMQSLDQGIRNYAGKHNGDYPNQLDSLVTKAGGAYLKLDAETTDKLQALPVAGTVGAAILAAFENNGVAELQFILNNDAPSLFEKDPNAQHSEASKNGVEDDADTATNLTIVANQLTAIPAVAGINTNITGACTVDAVNYSAANTLGGVAMTTENTNILNSISDSLEANNCNVVVALGVGGDAAANSEGAIGATASDSVKDKANTYSRYIALFQVAQDGIKTGVSDGVIDATEVFEKPRFVGIMNPLGEGTNQLNSKKNAK